MARGTGILARIGMASPVVAEEAETEPAPDEPFDEDAARAAARERLATARATGEEQWRRIEEGQREEAAYSHRFNQDVAELGKSGVRGAARLVDLIRGGIEAGGAALEAPSPAPRQPAGMVGLSTPGMAVPYREEPNAPPSEPPIPVQAMGEAIRHTAGYGPYETLQTAEPQWAARGEDYIPDDFWQGMREDPIRTLAINGIENLGPLAATLGAAAVAGPPGGLAMGGALTAGGTYNEAKANNATDEQALKAVGINLIPSMILEYFPVGRMISRMSKGVPAGDVARVVGNAIKSAAEEGSTESLQRIMEIISARAAYAEERGWGWDEAKDVLMNGLIGVVTAGPVSVATSMASADSDTITTREETSDAEDDGLQQRQDQPRLPDRAADQQIPGPRPERDRGLRAEARLGQARDQEAVTAAPSPAEPTPPPASTPSAAQGEGGVVSAEPEVEIISFEEPDQPGEIASHAGQGGESVEAINRQRSGNRYFRVRQSGEVVPLIGVDAVDARVGRGEAKVLVNPQGEVSLVDGRLTQPMQVAVDRMRVEAPPSRTAPAVDRTPPWEMNEEGLDQAIAVATKAERGAEERLFGVDGAKRYAALQRRANSFADRAAAEAASAEIARMESALTEEQRNLLFGVDQEGWGAEDLREFRDAVGRVGGDTPGDLGWSLQWAISRIPATVGDPSTLPHNGQLAYAQLKRGFEIAAERGWDTAEVSEAILRHAAGRFSDPADAAVVLDQFRSPRVTARPDRQLPSTAPQSAVESSTATEATQPSPTPSRSAPLPAPGRLPFREGERVRWGDREGTVGSGGEYRGTVRVNFDDGRSEVITAKAPERIEATATTTPTPVDSTLPLSKVTFSDLPNGLRRIDYKGAFAEYRYAPKPGRAHHAISQFQLDRIGGDESVSLNEMMSVALESERSQGTPPPTPRPRTAEEMAEAGLPESPASDFLPEQPKDMTAQGGFVGTATAAQPAAPLSFSRPEVEEGFQRGRRGAPEEGIIARIKDTAVRAGQAARRELKHVPSGAKFAPFRESTRRLRTYDPSNEVARQINDVVSPLTDKQYELFQRKTLLDDLDVIAREYEADTELPFGMTQEDLATDKPRIDEAAEADPYVKRAVERSKEVWSKAREDYRSAAQALGMDTSFLDRRGGSYLHHQVIEHALADGKRIKKIGKPKGRSFQRELTGSIKDINLRYGEVQGQVLTQLALDAEMARQLKNMKDKYDISADLKAKAKAASTEDKKVRWESLVPDTHGLWQPDEGSIFYLGQTVTDRIAKRLLEDGNAGIRITPDDLRQALVVGGKKETWVLPTEIVETLNEISNRRTSEVSKLNQTVVRAWKKLMLLMPRRFFKYGLRNVIGDTQKTVMGNPKAVLRFKQAAIDLGSYVYAKGEPNQTLKDWMARGGWQSGLFQQELEETEVGRQQRLRSATEMAGELEKVKDLRKLPRRYFAWAGKHVSFVEAINRYANYLEYLGQMESDPDGKPSNFGASRADEVMALDDPRDRAYWLSNQLIGAYDQVSEMGQILRRHYVPFWSFQELNVRSHWGLLRNAVTNPERALSNAQRAGVITRTMTPMVAWRVAKLFGLTMAFEAFLHAWNYGLFDEEEDDLPLDIRRTPHIVLGRDDEGNVLYFNRLSVFHELREWFGVDEFGYSLMDYLDGRISAKQMFKEVAAVPGHKLLNSIGPVSAGGVKSIFELATRKTTFPEPRDIHDRWDYAFRTVGMEEEFRKATGRPTPSGGYFASWRNAFIYSAEPGAAAYYDTLSAARRFRRSVGDDTQGSFFGSKTDALRNYKRALRYDQPEIAERYLRLYVAAGGTSRGFEQSLERMDPLSSVKKDDREAFEEWLTPDEKLKLEDAKRYYEEVFGPDSPGNAEALELIEKLEDEQAKGAA